jgi:hypothetical protein
MYETALSKTSQGRLIEGTNSVRELNPTISQPLAHNWLDTCLGRSLLQLRVQHSCGCAQAVGPEGSDQSCIALAATTLPHATWLWRLHGPSRTDAT